MELADFEFKKERKLGEFVQDFINLLKIIFSHMLSILLQLLALPICGMLLLSYFISTQIDSAFSIDGEYLFYLLALAFLALMIIGLIAFGFTIEYFILIRDRKAINFGVKEVWNSFLSNFSKYLKFFPGAIIVAILLIIPTFIALVFSIFIPFVGSLAIGVIFALLGLYFFSAFMLYREGYYELMDCYTAGFSIIKSRLFEYGIASYLVSFIFQALLYLITILPTLIIALIAYNYVGFTTEFFDTTFGKTIVSIGGMILTLFSIIYYMLAVISYAVIYETAKELKFGENVFVKISNIGKGKNE